MDISVNELLELYVDTLEKCGMHLLEMSDDYIGYYVFEEFDGGVVSFLHDNTLSKLRAANLITDTIVQKSSELRKRFVELEKTEQWNVQSVKHSREWREILELSDEIKSLLETL
jgi:hypothetical protein